MDTPKGPKTVEEARALPEDGGLTFRLDRMLAAAPVEGDDILMFIDADGRAMQVAFDGERWVKQEMH